MEEITLREAYNALKRNILLIVACAIIPAILVVAMHYISPNKYETKETIIFGNPETMKKADTLEYKGELVVNQQLMDNFKGMLENDTVFGSTATALKRPVSEVAGNINTKPVENSSLVEITVQGKTKEDVQKIKDAYIASLSKTLKDSYESVDIRNLSGDTNASIYPKKVDLILLVAAAFVGTMIGVCAAFLREYKNPKLYDKEQIEYRTNLNYLGQATLNPKTEEEKINAQILIRSLTKKFGTHFALLPIESKVTSLESIARHEGVDAIAFEPVSKNKASIIKSSADRVILVLTENKTSLKEFNRTKEALQNLGTEILGVIMV